MFQRGVVVGVAMLAFLSCRGEETPDVCEGVTCGAGRCANVDGAAACLCSPGFQAAGLTCEAIPPFDLCASSPCSGLTNSLCISDGTRARCVCPETRVEVNGACVVRTACTPNPCRNARRTTCEDEGGVAACRCDPGYAPEGDGCSALPVWSCAAQHIDGDAAEPDECPTLAHAMPFEMPEPHTIAPAGDHDWYELNVTPGRLVQFTAVSTTVQLLVEVFATDGVTLLASDNRGALDTGVVFAAPASARVLVRVRAVRGTDTGDYVATYRDAGVDDYVNTPAGALTLGASSTFAGQVQYAGDVDVVKLEMPARTAVRLGRPDAGADVVIEVSRADAGRRVLQPGESTVVTTAQLESFILSARGRNPRNLGAFQLAMEELGPDDHSDEPAFGTPLRDDGQPVAFTFERTDDVDSFRLTQNVGRIYSAEWTSSSSLYASVVADDGTVVAGMNSSSRMLAWKATSSRPASLQLRSSYGGSPQAPFTVTLTDLGVDDHADELVGATPVALGAATLGRLELASDVDTFAFSAVASHVMRATVTTNAAGVRTRVFSPAGDLLFEGTTEAGILAASTGTYKVQVLRSYSYAEGAMPYTLTVTDTGVDDHADTAGGATPLTFGTPFSGTVHYASDVDFFSFAPQLNHVYALACARPQGSCLVRVMDPGGNLVLNNAYGGSLQAFLASSAGTWTVSVAENSSFPQIGGYTLTVSDRGLEDHGATAATATAAPLGTAVSGTLGFVQDVDVFSFPVVAGRIYRATPSSSSSSGIRYEMRDAANTLLGASTQSGGASALATTTGTLYLHALPGYGLHAAMPFTVTVTDAGVDDHADTSATATPLLLDTRMPGELQYAGDVDVFSLTVTGKRHYRLSCTASGRTCGLTVLNGATVIASAYAYTNTSVLFTPPAGVTTVDVRVAGDDTSPYELLVTDLGADDHGDTLGEATVLALEGAALTGLLPVNSDVDVFSVATSAGEIVAVNCTTTSGSACALSLFNAAGISLTSTSAAPQVSTAVLSTGGTLRVEVRSNSYATGGYTLSATRSADDFTAPTTIALGTPRTGVIDYVGDTDVFQVALTAGVQVRLGLTYYSQGELHLPNGGHAATIYGGSSPATYTPAASGTFTIRVEAYSSSQPTGPYTLTVQ